MSTKQSPVLSTRMVALVLLHRYTEASETEGFPSSQWLLLFNRNMEAEFVSFWKETKKKIKDNMQYMLLVLRLKFKKLSCYIYLVTKNL